MTTHRNWALLTVAIIWLMTSWSLWCHVKNKLISIFFILALLIAQGFLLITAWYGGELVYRYGLGVIQNSSEQKTKHHH